MGSQANEFYTEGSQMEQFDSGKQNNFRLILKLWAFKIQYLYSKQKATDCRNISASKQASLKILFNAFLVQEVAWGLQTPWHPFRRRMCSTTPCFHSHTISYFTWLLFLAVIWYSWCSIVQLLKMLFTHHITQFSSTTFSQFVTLKRHYKSN